MYINDNIDETVKTIAATEFKAKCLRLIGQMGKNLEPITITRHGQPVAMLSPLPLKNESPLLVGAMRGSVLAFSEPFQPVTDPSDWIASQ